MRFLLFNAYRPRQDLEDPLFMLSGEQGVQERGKCVGVTGHRDDGTNRSNRRTLGPQTGMDEGGALVIRWDSSNLKDSST